MTLDAREFIRRFLIHVLPNGFHRIRYYGFLGNCHRDHLNPPSMPRKAITRCLPSTA
jgi:putative transposase